VAGLGDEELATIIRQDGIDILVDLSQHTLGNRLRMFARRPAPVQVSFAGYPASTGLEAIGYRISDRWLETELGVRSSKFEVRSSSGSANPVSDLPSSISETRPAEQVFLPDSFWCYDPCGAVARANELPATKSGFVTMGSLNSARKIHASVLRLWARVLRRVPNSRLLLLSGPDGPRGRFLETLTREGIEAERIDFVPRCSREGYLNLYHRLDLALDTFPYGGHTTSLDTLWMGVPVVTLAGERSVSRAGLSVLNNLGLQELVTFTEDEYVDAAANLANDLPRLAELRRTLRSRMENSVLMDGPRFARQIETAYRAMWQQWCRENPA
jgi:predicted O-linked N-acetylglucosamine transferase (SPINDLY family)